MKNKSIKPCLAFTKAVQLTPWGSIAPCCWYEGQIPYKSGFEFSSLDKIFQDDINTMKKGQWPANCNRCKIAELKKKIEVTKERKKLVFAGDVYEYYKKLCQQSGLRPLTQRRLSDIVSELDMLGIIHAKVISKGRYGRTREIKLTIPKQSQKEVKKVLEVGLDLS